MLPIQMANYERLHQMGFKIYEFDASGTFPQPKLAEWGWIFLVGGGGGGGRGYGSASKGGGGGGGGEVRGRPIIFTGDLDIVIGAGGIASTASDGQATDGGYSTISISGSELLKSLGGEGGYGGNHATFPAYGGLGGGQGYYTSNPWLTGSIFGSFGGQGGCGKSSGVDSSLYPGCIMGLSKRQEDAQGMLYYGGAGGGSWGDGQAIQFKDTVPSILPTRGGGGSGGGHVSTANYMGQDGANGFCLILIRE